MRSHRFFRIASSKLSREFMMKIFQVFAFASILMTVGIQLTGCATARVENLTPLQVALSSVEGIFKWDEKLQRWRFSEIQMLGQIVAEYRSDYAARQLISCITNTNVTKSSVDNGEQVTLGAICQTALSITTYYERAHDGGDLVNYPPELDPLASDAKFSEIKAAWQQALESGILVFY